MNKSFTINGKTYIAQPFTYNTICDLQDMGIDVERMGNRVASMARAFFAIWTGMTLEEAGSEIGEHIKNGGDIAEFAIIVNESMENSDFFPKETSVKKATTAKRTAKKSEAED